MRAYAALFFLLTACAPRQDYIISVDDSSDYELVQEAARDWNGCGVTVLTVTHAPGGDATVYHVPDDYAESDFSDPEVSGLTTDGTLVQYKSSFGGSDARAVTLHTIKHELGHVQGLGHMPGTIMQKKGIDGIWNVQSADCQALRDR